jgi:hypothetical protein
VALDLAHWLLSHKLSTQAKLLAARFDDHETACTIANLASAIDSVRPSRRPEVLRPPLPCSAGASRRRAVADGNRRSGIETSTG